MPQALLLPWREVCTFLSDFRDFFHPRESGCTGDGKTTDDNGPHQAQHKGGEDHKIPVCRGGHFHGVYHHDPCVGPNITTGTNDKDNGKDDAPGSGKRDPSQDHFQQPVLFRNRDTHQHHQDQSKGGKMGKIGHHVFQEPAKSGTRQQVFRRYGMSQGIGHGYIQEAALPSTTSRRPTLIIPPSHHSHCFRQAKGE